MRIFDNHVHVTPESLDFFASAFMSRGGTGINLVNLSENCNSLDDFTRVYHETEVIAGKLKEKGLEVVVSIGPYPVNLIEMTAKIGRESAKDVFKKAIDVAIGEIADGRANAIGEVGRPHFPTDEKIVEDSEEIMRYIFEGTKDNDIPVILHTESIDAEGMCSIMRIAGDVGKESKVVKHFSLPIFEKNCGIVPSVPASRSNARAAPWGREGFFLETDFAGDMGKPNFVLPPDSVPKRVQMLVQEGVDTEKIATSMEFYRKFYSLD